MQHSQVQLKGHTNQQQSKFLRLQCLTFWIIQIPLGQYFDDPQLHPADDEQYYQFIHSDQSFNSQIINHFLIYLAQVDVLRYSQLFRYHPDYLY
ncbi:hypothetical protein pb186bvf_004470 [Paramecium bursaria]